MKNGGDSFARKLNLLMGFRSKGQPRILDLVDYYLDAGALKQHHGVLPAVEPCPGLGRASLSPDRRRKADLVGLWKL
jgi:hypothetical protein